MSSGDNVKCPKCGRETTQLCWYPSRHGLPRLKHHRCNNCGYEFIVVEEGR